MRCLILYWHPLGSPSRMAVRGHLETLAAAVGRGGAARFNAVGGAPRILRRLEPDCVVLHTTFLGLRWTSHFDRWRDLSAWIGQLGVPVLAFPQDDYDHAHLLDEWLAELGATDVFTALPDHVDVLYPSRAGGAVFHGVLTGYLAGNAVGSPPPAVPAGLRGLDVVYRATRLPYWFGRHGQLKARLAEVAQREADTRRLRADISLEPARVVGGDAWPAFLASANTTIGCESGASAVDRRGELRAAIAAHLAESPGASFEEVAGALPAGWDEHDFFAISPRHLEAAAARTPQILVEGRYSGILTAHRHYIPVRPDLADLGSALEKARDPALLARLAECAFNEVVGSGVASQERLVAAVRSVLAARGCDWQRPPRRAWALAAGTARMLGGVRSVRRPGALVRRR